MDAMFSKPSLRPALVALPQLSSQTLITGSLVLAVVVIVLVVYILRSKSALKGNVVLLVGNEDAGKTAILSTMMYERTLPTHTSFQVNSALIPVPSSPKKQLQLVDVPGHPRLRSAFTAHVPDAKAIVFVVDASTITRNGRDVAEHLHHVLHTITSLPPTHALPPLLVLAHKTDLLSSPGSSLSASSQDRASLAIARVRTVLERELEKRRAAAAGGIGVEGLGAEDDGEGAIAELGGLECRAGGAFRFSEWDGGEVGFVGTCVKVGAGAEKSAEEKGADADGLDELRAWLDDLA
ncbi:signal recognition particle receptor beta subunit-domain-containing protein [Phellopilus nigrolimitatus]|nr:signal recognition particle receptor beta subunit-domain-containing protein [Phellopilus nigrolimitatus]